MAKHYAMQPVVEGGRMVDIRFVPISWMRYAALVARRYVGLGFGKTTIGIHRVPTASKA